MEFKVLWPYGHFKSLITIIHSSSTVFLFLKFWMKTTSPMGEVPFSFAVEDYVFPQMQGRILSTILGNEIYIWVYLITQKNTGNTKSNLWLGEGTLTFWLA